MSKKASGLTADDKAFVERLLALSPRTLHENVAVTVEKALGRSMPQMEVRFRDLTITADVVVPPVSVTRSSKQQRASYATVGNAIPRALAARCAAKSTVTRRTILNGLCGIFQPGTITLVLGQPGSGKSSFMKTLSGRFPTDKHVSIDGAVTLNGRTQHEMRRHLAQCVSYVTQQDCHFPTLTVKETLAFAHACCGSALTKFQASLFQHGTPDEIHDALALAQCVVHNMPAIVLQQLGLQSCEDTVVGDAMLRGISGGQRKRVTTGEMQFGWKNVLLMDEISTGLDSAATFDIVHTHRSLAQRLHKTIVISLLQPSPEVFALFDSVLLLQNGELLYHGPRENVQAHFERLGLVCPPRRDVADFLLDLGTEQQTQYEASRDQQRCRTAKDFADAFRQSEIYQATLRALDASVAQSLRDDLDRFVAHKTPFFQSFLDSTRTVTLRQLRIARRNTTFLKGRAVMVVVMGLLYGTVFYQFTPTAVQVVMGMLFSAVLFLSLGQASQIPTFMAARDVFYRQRGAHFYRTLSYALACSASQVPLAIAESLVFGSLVYGLCGFVRDVTAYLVFLLVLFVTNLVFAAWFFFVSCAASDVHIAKPVAMVTILFFVLFAGFVISKDQLPVALQWIYWIDPTAWCLRALAVNQYRAPAFNTCVYGGVDYCKRFGGRTMGEYYLSLYDVPSETFWVPLGVAFLVLAYVVFMALAALTLEYKRYETHGNHTSVTKADEAEQFEQLLRQSSGARQHETLPPAGVSTSAKVIPVSSLADKPMPKPSVPPVTLAFQDLWYTVPDPSNPRETIDLLQGVTGIATPGTMTALMGSSGAGKTTLLDVIAGRKTGGKIRGAILLNGHAATTLAIRRCTAYCEQMDIHSETATVREALTFSALLRQPGDVPLATKLASVHECLELLDLYGIADELLRGFSTEQMKRVTIGVELAAQPSVLFLDEPTSGLDARAAKTIMDGVRKVANTGRTVVCTIHQPSADVFQLFDRLLLLQRGGETVFYGDLGTQCDALIHYLEAVPGVPAIAAGSNPATWMLECIGAGVGSKTTTNFVEHFQKSTLRQTLDHKLQQDGVARPSANLAPLQFRTTYAAGHAVQMRLLVQRFLRMYWRTPSYNLTRMVISVVLALVFGGIYADAQYTSFQGLNGGVGMVFLTTVFLAMVSFNAVVPLASEERASFYREQHAQMYHPVWYFVGSTVAELPYVALSVAAFTLLFFPLVGFWGGTLVLYWFTLSLHVLLLTYLGQLLAYALPSVDVALTMGVLLNSICALFMGFNPPAAAIPSAYQWLYQLTPHRYVLGTLVAIVFGDCQDDSKAVGCAILQSAPPTLGRVTVQQYLERVFGVDHTLIGRNLLVIIAAILVVRLLALLALCFCATRSARIRRSVRSKTIAVLREHGYSTLSLTERVQI